MNSRTTGRRTELVLPFGVLGSQVAEEVPGRAHECIKRVHVPGHDRRQNPVSVKVLSEEARIERGHTPLGSGTAGWTLN